jgi:ribose transport system ATP-binding protein
MAGEDVVEQQQGSGVDPGPALSSAGAGRPTAPADAPRTVEKSPAAAAAGHDGKVPLLEVKDLSKAFPGVQALSGVSLSLDAGEILALVGENGAGKSTLIKILTGLYQADSGSVRIAGEPAASHSPQDAIARGIAVVPQERNLIPRFSVGENIYLDAPPRVRGLIDYEKVHDDAQRWLELLELDVDSRTPVTKLSVAQMQLVEIARALSHEGRILLLDEPTASITPAETKTLFRVLRRLRDHGVGMIFVSHKLEEVFELCDHISVLRDGRNAGPQRPTSELTRDDVITLMVGRESITRDLPERHSKKTGIALELRGVATAWGARDIDLKVGYGEIVGLYGLVGAGRTELARAIIGADEIVAGEVLVAGQPARIGSVAEALGHYRIGYVSEDRKDEGLILIHSVLKNVTVTVWHRLQNAVGWITTASEKSRVQPMVERLDIKAPSLATVVSSLSGGNQQKVSLAKWLTAGVDVLIIDEPTVGIDVRTKGNLHELIWELAGQGLAVLLISSDMPEMVNLADRIVVMRDGRIVGELDNSRVYDDTSQQIMSFIQSVNGTPATSQQGTGGSHASPAV